jgi:hypothetical protein
MASLHPVKASSRGLLHSESVRNPEESEVSSQIDWRDLYRPTNPDDLAAAIRRMAKQGLKPRDVASMLRLDIAVVLEALRAAA